MSSQRRLLKALLIPFFLLLVTSAYSQRVVTGKVSNDKNDLLAGATVTILGNKAVAVKTNAQGEFSITVPTETKSLEISYTGHNTKEVSIVGKNSVDVVLILSSGTLDSVVVVGYGSQKVKDVTGAISQVKGDAIKNLATQDAATLLQGRVAGVDVVTSSGQPGVGSQITIRGVSSLNNPNPLFVIDGVQQSSNNVNPQDIESMSVLKDASAAAIYGASAAGGVIIITTKKGKGTKPTINLSTRFGFTKAKLIENLLNKTDFVQYKKDIKNPDYSDPNNAAIIDALLPIDWNKELYRNGMEQNYSVSVSGANPGFNYFFSGQYNKQKGVFLDNESSMAGARLNSEVKITNAIKVGEQLNVWTRTTTPVKTPIVSTPFISQPVFTGPLYSAVPGTEWGIYPFSYPGFNSVAQIKTANFEFPSNSFQGQVYLEAKLPIKYMTFKATFGYTSQYYENNLFQNKYQTNGTPLTTAEGIVQNHLYRNIGNYQQTLNAYILAYDHTWGVHTVNLLGGYEQYARKTRNLAVDLQNVLGTSYGVIPSSSTLSQGGQNVGGGYDQNGLVKSQFGRINYDLDKRYYATFTVRRDANFTTFGENMQHGIFPAYSAGWNIDQERFFKKYKHVLNQLKIRASYGEVGNSAIGDYKFLAIYQPGIVQNFQPGGSPTIGYTQETIANQDIQWESTHETNIGLDGQLLNGKIYFNIDWYSKNTTKLLFEVPVAPSSGVPTNSSGFNGGPVVPGVYLQNIGKVRNRGVDIAIGYNGKARKVNYSIGLTGSFNTNKVIDLESASTGLADGHNDYPYGTSAWSSYALTRTFVNHSFGQFWGKQSLGIISNDEQLAQAQVAQPSAQLGDLMFLDKNHDNVIDDKDDTLIGNAYPKFTYGVTLTANWKKFDISILLNGAMGLDLYNGVTPYEFESLNGSNVTDKVFETSGFTHNGVTNGITKYPSVGRIDGFGRYAFDPNGNYTKPSSFFVENGSYLKLKNIQIGYTVSSPVLTRAKVKSIRFYVMANNLLTFTKYSGVDPELGSQYAILGLDVNGNPTGNPNGSAGTIGKATTSRGIDGPAKYPNVKLYTAGIDFVF